MKSRDLIDALKISSCIVAVIGLLEALIVLIQGVKLLQVESGGLAGLCLLIGALSIGAFSCLLVAIAFGLAVLIEGVQRATESLRRLEEASTSAVTGSSAQEDPSPAYEIPEAARSEGGVPRVLKRHVDTEENTVVAEGQEVRDKTTPLRLTRMGATTPSSEEELETFNCPWCGRLYAMNIRGGNAVFHCVDCSKQVIVSP